MNDVEKAISAWREQLFTTGIKSRTVLDELENHLREDIGRQVRSGTAVASAFANASRRIGTAGRLKEEFDRIGNDERKHMKRKLMIGAGVIGVLIGMALVMPAVAQYRQIGAMHKNEPWLFLLGSLMTLAGGATTLRNLRRKRA